MKPTVTFNTLETERLVLREINPEIYHLAYSLWKDEAIISFFGLHSHEELASEKIKFEDGMTTFNKTFLFFHLLDKSTQALIGWCGFHTCYLPHKRAEIGYEIYDAQKRGKGLMKEAMIRIIQYGFETMQLNRIEALIGPDNIPSIRLIRSLGFKEEGIMRENYFKNNGFEDSIIFSMLESEYRNNN